MRPRPLCPASFPALRLRSGRARRLADTLVFILAPALAVGALGCGEDAQTPASPEAAQTLVATSTPLSFRQVSAGDRHTCGVTTDDRAYCWGTGGLLGDGTTTSSTRPVAVAGGLSFLAVSAGVNHTCGVTTANRAYCWGANDVGQLGTGQLASGGPSLTPVAVAGGRHFRQVSAGEHHSCGVTPYDEPFCWGSNNFGVLGTGPGVAISTTPVRVAGGLRFRQLSAGFSHTCGATTDYRGYCWGFPTALGAGKQVITLKPVAVLGGLSFRQVLAGSGAIPHAGEQVPDYASSCGVTTEDRAYCWGVEYGGTPTAVAGGRRYRFVSPGAFSACGVTIFDVALCWGENTDGQMGTGDGSSPTPVLVAGGLRFNAVSASGIGRHTCGVTTEHRAYCWGDNSTGQLGDGTTTDRSTPVAVVGPN
jgi:alpha-tubulin suppressor-like RCC1 family protein